MSERQRRCIGSKLYAVVYANVTQEDHDRLMALAAEDGLSCSEWLRGCLNDSLEAIGEPPLQSFVGKLKDHPALVSQD